VATVLTAVGERRTSVRVKPDLGSSQAVALLRPGREVRLINISEGGALIESPTRLNPKAAAKLQLFGAVRLRVSGRVQRCRVSSLAPLTYEGAIVFDERIAILDVLESG
jgi:PilZ domain